MIYWNPPTCIYRLGQNQYILGYFSNILSIFRNCYLIDLSKFKLFNRCIYRYFVLYTQRVFFFLVKDTKSFTKRLLSRLKKESYRCSYSVFLLLFSYEYNHKVWFASNVWKKPWWSALKDMLFCRFQEWMMSF